MSVKIAGLSAQMQAMLDGLQQSTIDAVERAVDQTAQEVDAEIRAHISFTERTGDYVAAFAVDDDPKQRAGTYRKVWHVKGSQARLTHLLEKGHAARNGGRTRAFPHIQYGAKLARKNLVRHIEEEMNP